MWFGYFQFGMIGLITLKTYHIPCPFWSIPLWGILFVAISLVIGWLDFKLGLMRAEQKRVSELNPFLTEIQQKLEDIEEKRMWRDTFEHSLQLKELIRGIVQHFI